jgi:protein-S-isoprenylcysteine O-methyltransferase Ste14
MSLLFTFALYGKGTHAPIDPPRHLAVCGTFKHVRNPGCTGAFTAFMGESLFVQSGMIILLAVLLACSSHPFVIYCKEPGLKRQFGKVRKDYLRRVLRWLPYISKLK